MLATLNQGFRCLTFIHRHETNKKDCSYAIPNYTPLQQVKHWLRKCINGFRVLSNTYHFQYKSVSFFVFLFLSLSTDHDNRFVFRIMFLNMTLFLAWFIVSHFFFRQNQFIFRIKITWSSTFVNRILSGFSLLCK